MAHTLLRSRTWANQNWLRHSGKTFTLGLRVSLFHTSYKRHQLIIHTWTLRRCCCTLGRVVSTNLLQGHIHCDPHNLCCCWDQGWIRSRIRIWKLHMLVHIYQFISTRSLYDLGFVERAFRWEEEEADILTHRSLLCYCKLLLLSHRWPFQRHTRWRHHTITQCIYDVTIFAWASKPLKNTLT